MNTIEKIIEFFNENDELFSDCMEELDSYNGYLGDDRYYEMDVLNEFYANCEPLELLQRAYFGRDNDTWTTDGNGNRTYGEFNPNRYYFKYNGYGNLVSTNYKDYSAQLDHYAIEAMLENIQWIDTINDNDELKALFEQMEDEQ